MRSGFGTESRSKFLKRGMSLFLAGFRRTNLFRSMVVFLGQRITSGVLFSRYPNVLRNCAGRGFDSLDKINCLEVVWKVELVRFRTPFATHYLNHKVGVTKYRDTVVGCEAARDGSSKGNIQSMELRNIVAH